MAENKIVLEKIKIENYHSLLNTEVSFLNSPSILIGRNGAGKTSIMNAVMLLRRLFCGDDESYRPRHSKDSDNIRHSISATLRVGKTYYELDVDIQVRNINGGDRPVSSSVKMREGNKRDWIELGPDTFRMLRYLRDSVIDEKDIRRFVDVTTSQLKGLAEITRYFEAIRYYESTQFSNPTASPVSLELNDSKLVRRSRDSHHEKFLYDLYIAKQTDTVMYERYLNFVSADGINLVNSIDFKELKVPSNTVTIAPGGRMRKISKERLFVVPLFTLDGTDLSPNQLSEGTFKTLALVFYLLQSDESMILIEEPEVNIHQGLLGDLMELINFQAKTRQIVVSTHSEYVLDHLEPEHIIFVAKNKKGTTAATLNESLEEGDLAALQLYLRESGTLGEYWRQSKYFDD